MTFRMTFLSRSMACNEVLGYMLWGLDCVVVCGAPVPADYIPNIDAYADMSDDFIYEIFWCDITLFVFIGSGRILFALCGSRASVVVCFLVDEYECYR